MVECCLMKDSEVSCDAKIDAVLELLDTLASGIGYKFISLVSCGKSCRRCACVFRRDGCFDYLKTKTDDGRLEVAELDMPSSCNGKVPMPLYCVLAKELYRLLDDGRAMYVAGKKLEAGMFPEFMVAGAILGLCQAGEDDGRELR